MKIVTFYTILFFLAVNTVFSQENHTYCFDEIKEKLLEMTNIPEPKIGEVYFMHVKNEIKYDDKTFDSKTENKIWFSSSKIEFINEWLEFYQDEEIIVSINNYDKSISISKLVQDDKFQELKFQSMKNIQTGIFQYIDNCNCVSVSWKNSYALKLACDLKPEGVRKYKTSRFEFLYDDTMKKVLKTITYFSPENKKRSMLTEFLDIDLKSDKKLKSALSHIYYNNKLLTKYKNYTINDYTKMK